MEDSCRIQFVQQLLDSMQACLDIKTLIENQRCIQIFKSIYGSKCRQDDAKFLNNIHLDEFYFLLFLAYRERAALRGHFVGQKSS